MERASEIKESIDSNDGSPMMSAAISFNKRSDTSLAAILIVVVFTKFPFPMIIS